MPNGIIARILAMVGDTPTLAASSEITTIAATITRMEVWPAWFRRVFVYTSPKGETWNRCGIETFIRYLMRYGIVPTPPRSDTRNGNVAYWELQSESTIHPFSPNNIAS